MATLKYKNGSTWTAMPTASNASLGNPSVLSVSAGTGTPGVSVSMAGATLAPTFRFSFTNLQGADGATGPTGPAGPRGTLRAYAQLSMVNSSSIYRNSSAPASWSTMRVYNTSYVIYSLNRISADDLTLAYSTYSIRATTGTTAGRYVSISFSYSYGGTSENGTDWIWAAAGQSSALAPSSTATVNCYNQATKGPLWTNTDQLTSCPVLYPQLVNTTWYYQMYHRLSANTTCSAAVMNSGTWMVLKDFGAVNFS